MKYKNYEVYDFITDDDFKRWVLTPADRDDVFWKSWLNSHPQNAHKVLEAREILVSLKFKESPQDAVQQNQIFQKIIEGQRPARFQTNRRGKRVVMDFDSKVLVKNIAAASVIVFLGLSYWFYAIKEPKSVAQVSSPIELVSKNTENGQRSNLSLSDGSKIKLNAASELLIPVKFTDTSRVVQLTSGEAFFDITRDEKRPFVVNTEDVSISVLGTAFNVSAYDSDNIVEVSVTEGKVAVSKPDKKIAFYLTPGESCYLDKKTGILNKGTFDPDKILAWKNGILFFEDADLEEVTRDLERWYGVDFTTEGDRSIKRKFNGRFENASLETVLEAFSFSSWFDYELRDKQVTIKLKNL